jgi:A/G-specific adenine glycosylase
MDNTNFATRLLNWFDHHGRKHLPWQHERTPYKVWISEIMLQQTQVATVIPYFGRFMERFPALEDLAQAKEDEVLHLWTGLGYYARARNLHKCAQYVLRDYNGQFPTSIEELQQLPGIGRSTAGAIISLGTNGHAVILDGNVKRVLTRHQKITGWPEHSATLKTLWKLAAELTPKRRCPDYTQAIMDLGATVCVRSKPLCELCPISNDCKARLTKTIANYPSKKPKQKVPTRSTTMLLCVDPVEKVVLLEKRQPHGIWGGLWSFPEVSGNSDIPTLPCHLVAKTKWEELPPIRHTFSHFYLDITPTLIPVRSKEKFIEQERWHWYDLQHEATLGLAAPVQRLMQTLAELMSCETKN